MATPEPLKLTYMHGREKYILTYANTPAGVKAAVAEIHEWHAAPENPFDDKDAYILLSVMAVRHDAVAELDPAPLRLMTVLS